MGWLQIYWEIKLRSIKAAIKIYIAGLNQKLQMKISWIAII
jgi:hypothetical protein